MTAQFADICNKMRRAIRNGERLHLEPEHVAAIMGSAAYQEFTRLEAAELEAEWLSRSDSANFGSRGEMTVTNGQSAGTIHPLEPDVESQLASAASTMVIRQAKRKRPLPNIISDTASPKRSTPTLKPVPAGS